MRTLMTLGVLLYGVSHPAAAAGCWHALAALVGVLAHASLSAASAEGARLLLGSHWH